MLRLFDTSFKNPVFLASGVFGFGLKYTVVTNSVGAFFTKGVTLKPRAGNPPPRIFETPSGLINWVGLENPGVKVFCTHILPQLRTLRTRIFVNVAGFRLDEFVQVIDMIGDEVDGFELNISCPNVKQGGVAFGQDAGLAASVVASARKRTKRPLIAKLTPNFCNPREIARACVDAGADGISLINTVYGLAYDIYEKQPLIKGGLSGPAIKPFALFCVNHVRDCGVPVIGMGGITSGRDAYEFLLAGASAVAVGSAVLRDPYAPIQIIKELKKFPPPPTSPSGKGRSEEGV
jgi:dihydroorotate dehydrogenase (NAD+) catalytic subunit